ncbi:hypothetical protein Fsol_00223 [Candidatus Fokinia solitaria]|uniref:Uncharacterized protein n=1 Tax=Candidatus Fokinia solitaria TaxID=1802984 RepID=A0A2U8BRS2_9RICK|nr:hypothetical protein [Candidatus Fokinia solitaria]AWD33027.1 hypothetical protein Fsol_00223 [Candidatus Fokinia solitaria]
MNKNLDVFDDILAEEISERWQRVMKLASIVISLGFICIAVFIGVKQFYDYKKTRDAKADAVLFTDMLYENPSEDDLQRKNMQYKTDAYIGLYENYKLGLILRNYEPVKAIVKCQKIADLKIDEGITEYNRFLAYSLRLRSGIAKNDDTVITHNVSVYHILQDMMKMSLYTAHNDGENVLATSSKLISSFHLSDELRMAVNEITSYIIIGSDTNKKGNLK